MKRGMRAESHKVSMRRDRVNLAGFAESIWWPIYDYTTLPLAGANSTVFFQEPIGQGGKTLEDTNMELSGQIPKGQAFTITGVQFEIYPGVEITQAGNAAALSEFNNDVYNVLQGGVLVLRIGSKEYIRQGNLMKFPPVNRLAGFTSNSVVALAAADASLQTNYAVGSGREHTVANMLLESNQNFDVDVRNLSALPSGVDARIGVTLNGWLHRNAQ